nr:phage Gp37/Gp68 family protein [Mycobacterium sp. UM_NZ2]
MSARTKIEWADDTWNPVTGCTEVSPGCDRCYAKTFAERFRGTPGHYFERGFDVQLRPDKLDLPLRWRRPRRIFVNSMSDLFHDDVPDEYIAQVWAVMALAPRHTFQVLTKRHGRMHSLLTAKRLAPGLDFEAMVRNVAHNLRNNAKRADWTLADDLPWPLPNVWLGVSTENQQWADIRIPALLDTPAAVRWISAEPLLGPIGLHPYWTHGQPRWGEPEPEPTPNGGSLMMRPLELAPRLDWVVVGGESGHRARPMHPDWARSLRDQCTDAGVPFLFKQWGEWSPYYYGPELRRVDQLVMADDGGEYRAGDLDWPDGPRRGEAQLADFPHHRPTFLYRVGKKAAGRQLDGRTWDQYPEAVS